MKSHRFFQKFSRRCLFGTALLTCALSITICASAQDADQQRRMLDQRRQQRQLQRERNQLQQDLLGEVSITVDGRSYPVGDNVDDVGRALYLALQQQQWELAARLLQRYEQFPAHETALVHYARGSLARMRGDFPQAEHAFERLLAEQPGFLLARLALARTLFEDQQDQQAAEMFTDIARSLDASDPKTQGVRASIEGFQKALADRGAWNGSFALGPAWTDNLNRTSASQDCLLFVEQECFVMRRTADAITSVGLDMDANLSRQWSLRGHHGAYVQALGFGQAYRNNSDYNEASLTTQAGYRYRSGRHQIDLAPSLDYNMWGNHTLNVAWGAHGQWSWMANAQGLLRVEADVKNLRHRTATYAENLDGWQRSLFATWFQAMGSGVSAFLGVDVVDSQAAEPVNAYLQRGLRAGLSGQPVQGVDATLFASWRRRDYGAYSAVLDARRDDIERGYTLVVKAPRWSWRGFAPVLTLRYQKIASNVDWLYSYDRNFLSIKLERLF